MTKLCSLLLMLLLSVCAFAGASEVPVAASSVSLSLDAGLVTLIKISVPIVIGLLLVYAVIGVTFFGFNIRDARKSLKEATDEISENLKALKATLEELESLKQRVKALHEDVQEVGSKVDELAEPAHQSEHHGIAASNASPSELDTVIAAPIDGRRTHIDLIREVIASSRYEWTTIGRIMKGTGLSRDEIMKAAQGAMDIKIGRGRTTKDFIFKFSEVH
jgi:uncharacterized protein YoxC